MKTKRKMKSLILLVPAALFATVNAASQGKGDENRGGGSATEAIPPIAFFVHPPEPVCAHPDVPKELHFGKEQGKLYADEEMDEFKELGYEKRMPYRAGHSFTRWVKKFWDTKRGYFGQLPNGQRGLTYPGLASYVPNLSKVCVSSEAVIEEKLAEWERAKRPQLLIAGENDGDMGYCRCGECLKMDVPVENTSAPAAMNIPKLGFLCLFLLI